MSTPSIEGYACEVYLDDLLNPDNYRNNLELFGDLLLRADFCSPLHSRDLDGDGNPKKSHYHLLFGPNTDKKSIAIILGKISTTSEILVKERAVLPIYHYDNYYQYLTHSDKKSQLDPSKADYSKCKLLWKNPNANVPTREITEYEGLVSYYNKNCLGMDYDAFIDYVVANNPVLLSCEVIHQFAFITYVRSKHLRNDMECEHTVQRIRNHNNRLVYGGSKYHTIEDKSDNTPFDDVTEVSLNNPREVQLALKGVGHLTPKNDGETFKKGVVYK